jgi:hypothetical protein
MHKTHNLGFALRAPRCPVRGLKLIRASSGLFIWE